MTVSDGSKKRVVTTLLYHNDTVGRYFPSEGTK